MLNCYFSQAINYTRIETAGVGLICLYTTGIYKFYKNLEATSEF
jgi:hypothetical protein